MTEKKLDVSDAYALRTPQDNLRFYADWAEQYDSRFAIASDYVFPQRVAEVFAERGGGGPVLDAGAGTGLVAEAIRRLCDVALDALDLSAEMLAVAREKDIYRHLIEADMTRVLPIEDARYAGIVSAGTFTHGHVGPDAFDELMRVAASGALFVLTIKAELFRTKGFDVKLEALAPKISDLDVREVQVYGDGADSAHAEDKGLIVSFVRS
ncbi:MAG: methyltransferase domain-containing protein [Pseudomonadota bacterium]